MLSSTLHTGSFEIASSAFGFEWEVTFKKLGGAEANTRRQKFTYALLRSLFLNISPPNSLFHWYNHIKKIQLPLFFLKIFKHCSGLILELNTTTKIYVSYFKSSTRTISLEV
jgi:hypothetical protein